MVEPVEAVCARILARIEAKLYSLRYIVEKMKPRVPRGLLNALCLGVLRNYRLLIRALRYCGYRGDVRGNARGWLPIVIAYEAMFRHDSVPAEKLRSLGVLGGETIDCLRGLEPKHVVSGLHGLERLAVLYSMPLWVVEELAKAEPPGGIEELLKSFQEPTPIWIRFNKRRLSREQAIKMLEAIGISVKPDPVLDDSLEVIRVEPGAIERLDNRLFYVQDRAAMLASHLLGKFEGAVYDFFSAPGNKLAHTYWRSGPTYAVALEVSRRRLHDEQRLLQRQAVLLVDAAEADATRPPLRPGSGRAIIVDPDCTSMGRLGHSPETRLFLERAGRRIVERLAELQEAGLRAALRTAARGAKVVYMTCTLTLRENEEVVRKVVEDGLAELVEAKPLIGVWSPFMRKTQRVYPHMSKCTGGFAALLIRV
ncbi:RsmB/NOP family class I SAM-dependent RNA methyltransferase [Hyperthermus butylicus]|uniref:tRNA and rRNA cytosine-C5-methylase n=1 Tax=Hyperthermus butylicus (strain DSM 5456 / JCM 9403 / PLM1-5) TaxID=415426 RepID=A2BJV2_HYPBU|nr:RsmB/NOP family class I SAM-dependent RNA methyltransferase [Hyperthermus butylicus]ABM80263.1 tRNA and rRNA cytosine-C5-methylase [Hyperthermus butylicus DSM 5456]